MDKGIHICGAVIGILITELIFYQLTGYCVLTILLQLLLQRLK